MSTQQIEKVTAVTKANVYFDGKVVSHTLLLPDGGRKTLGLIYPGQYHFTTDAPELVELVAGACSIRVDGDAQWQNYAAGTHFRVRGKAGFDIRVEQGLTEYVCTFE